MVCFYLYETWKRSQQCPHLLTYSQDHLNYFHWFFTIFSQDCIGQYTLQSFISLQATISNINVGFPGGSGLKNPPATWAHSLSWGAPLGEMAAHSSILAWEIPQTEASGRLQPMGSQRVKKDWAITATTTATITATTKHTNIKSN